MSNQNIISVEPKDLKVQEVFRYLIDGVGPRPIALVSTVSADGVANLAPFSFFNVFGSNPPTLAFSPARRGRDGTLKDTYLNLMHNKECVVQVVTRSIVEQVNLASTEYGSETDEFEKSGLTPMDSDLVTPKRVQESPFQMECRLLQMVHLGDQPASGNLAICEVVKFHISKEVMTNGVIDQQKIDLVGRMGGSFYAHAHGDALFELGKPSGSQNLGMDGLPEHMKKSHVYSANNLARFALVEHVPSMQTVHDWLQQQHIEVKEFQKETALEAFHQALDRQDVLAMFNIAYAMKEQNDPQGQTLLERTAKCALENQDIELAWNIALVAKP